MAKMAIQEADEDGISCIEYDGSGLDLTTITMSIAPASFGLNTVF